MKLLKNILPESIIQRMQSGQKFVADSHQHVVILFSGERPCMPVCMHMRVSCARACARAWLWVCLYESG